MYILSLAAHVHETPELQGQVPTSLSHDVKRVGLCNEGYVERQRVEPKIIIPNHAKQRAA